jgi:ABC-type multidrug transport system fused ATPase/permease subunit
MRRSDPWTPSYRQGEHAECGLAALAILMGYHGVHVSLTALREEAGSTLLGSTVRSLRDLARLRGFQATAHRVEPEQLEALGLPLIVHYRFIHFVVVESVSQRWVRINDPAGGPRIVPFEEFADDFTGVVLRLQRPFGLAASGRYVSAWRRYRQMLARHAIRVAIAAMATIIAAAMIVAGLSLLANSAVDHLYKTASALSLAGALPSVALIAGGLIIEGVAVRLAASVVLDAAMAEQRRAEDVVFASPTALILSRGSQQTRRFLSTLLTLRDPRAIAAALGGLSFLTLTLACPLLSATSGSLVALVQLAQLAVLLAVSFRRGGRIARRGGGRLPVAGFAAGAYAQPDALKISGGGDVLFCRTAGVHALQAAEALDAAADGIWLETLLRVIDLGKAIACTMLLLTAATPAASSVALSLLLLAAASSLALLDIGHGLHLAPIANTLHGLVEPATSPAIASRPAVTGARLVLSDLSWQPARLRPAIVAGVSGSASPGTILAIKGASGSGLSTMARLAAGWLAPSSGDALLSDVALTQVPEGSIIFLDADVPLDSATLRDNLCFGHPIDDAALCEALRAVGLFAALAARGGLELWITRERPALSGGELCRLAIARALCRGPAVLVLDGVLDAVEVELAAAIAQRIVARGIALVLTSARAETLALANSIINLSPAAGVSA